MQEDVVSVVFSISYHSTAAAAAAVTFCIIEWMYLILKKINTRTLLYVNGGTN